MRPTFQSDIFKAMFINLIVSILIISNSIIAFPTVSLSLDNDTGKQLFLKHCSGCHINGGNIIRRGKTLKMSDLKRRGLDDPEAIARVTREGIGIMSGYNDSLKKGEDIIISNWIFEQAQKAWVQG